MTEDSPNSPANRRTSARRTAFKSARIRHGTVIVECRIRNISDGGARLELRTPQLLPHNFDLEAAGMPTRRCTLRWAKGNLVGVQFEPQ